MKNIYKFKTLEEQNEWELIQRLKAKQIDELDRYEQIRVRVSPYPPGTYKFKTLEEKWQDEFERVMVAWDLLTKNENKERFIGNM